MEEKKEETKKEEVKEEKKDKEIKTTGTVDEHVVQMVYDPQALAYGWQAVAICLATGKIGKDDVRELVNQAIVYGGMSARKLSIAMQLANESVGDLFKA